MSARVFERGGWARFDKEAGTVMDEIYRRADAFLFGRRTYEIFAGSWGTWDDPGDSPIWTALEHAAQVRGIDHTLRTRRGRTRPSSPVTSRPPSAS